MRGRPVNRDRAPFFCSMSEEQFKIHIPFDVLEKSRGGDRLIGGICSTDDLDQQQERLIQEGLDFGPFLKSGWFNDNHAKETGAAIGEPTRAELRTLGKGRTGWYVEGFLYDTPRAQSIFELAKSLNRPESTRKLGFSVEGAIMERDPTDPGTVRKAIVREIAVTRCPVNVGTELQLLAKSLSVGTNPAPTGTPITGDGAGAVLAPEALEKKPKKKGDEDEEEDDKPMTKSEAEAWLRTRGVPERLVPVALAMAVTKTTHRRISNG